MADPVLEPAGEPEAHKRPVVSPDLDPVWRPASRPVQESPEERPFWLLETRQFVLLLMALVAVAMLVMFGMLVSSFFHAAQSATGLAAAPAQ